MVSLHSTKDPLKYYVIPLHSTDGFPHSAKHPQMYRWYLQENRRYPPSELNIQTSTEHPWKYCTDGPNGVVTNT